MQAVAPNSHPQLAQTGNADDNAAELVRASACLLRRTPVLATLYFDHAFPEIKRPGRLVLSFNQLALGRLYCAMTTSLFELPWEPVAPDGSDSILCQETLA